MTFAVSVVTLFPEAFPGALDLSVVGRAREQGLWSLQTVNLRDFGIGPHKNVDDTPAGGGAGMVIRADVAATAIDSIGRGGRPLLHPSARGQPLTQNMVRGWAKGPGLIVFCSRFEGVDERVIAGRDMEEVSVGDAVLAGGEVATLLILEATLRLLPGVLGNEASLAEESFEEGFLEQPQYTRPREWEGRTIPDILLSGDHAKVAAWRQAERQRVTAERRPDLLRPAPSGDVRKETGDAPILPLPHPLPAAGESDSD